MSRAQQVGCRRAAALAHGLARELEQLLRDGGPPAADRLRTAVAGIDFALGVGLKLELAPDPEVTYRRGHARNLALVLRRTVEASWSVHTDAVQRVDLLSQAVRFADDLAETVTWIRQRALELEAPPPLEAWTASWAGRLLALTARLLPPHLRREFVEDHCGNLASVVSRREWLGYLLGLLARMPSIAAAAAPGRSRW